MNAYYIKRLDFSIVAISANSSWLMRNIIDNRVLLDNIGGRDAIIKEKKFSIKQAYNMLKGIGILKG